MIEKEFSKNKYFVQFSSIADLKNWLTNAKPNKAFSSKDTQSSLGDDVYFRGTKSFEEAQELMEKGWEDGAKEITGKFNKAKMEHKATIEKQKAIYDVAGFQPCVPRYLQGVPTSMINKKNVKVQNKVMNIYKSIAYSAKWEAKDMITEGVKALLIVDKLEQNGYRCNLFTIFTISKGGVEVTCSVKVKSSNDKLNIFKMAYLLAHPSFLRRHMFRFIECYEHITSDFVCGYGKPADCKRTMEVLKSNNIKDDYVFIDKETKLSFEQILDAKSFEEIKHSL